MDKDRYETAATARNVRPATNKTSVSQRRSMAVSLAEGSAAAYAAALRLVKKRSPAASPMWMRRARDGLARSTLTDATKPAKPSR